MQSNEYTIKASELERGFELEHFLCILQPVINGLCIDGGLKYWLLFLFKKFRICRSSLTKSFEICEYNLVTILMVKN